MREWRRVTDVGPRFNRAGLECMSGVDGAAARSAPACGFEILQRARSLLVGRAAGGGSSLFYAGGISPLGRVDSRVGRWLMLYTRASLAHPRESIVCRVAKTPWEWSDEVTILDPGRDGPFSLYMHDPGEDN